MKLNSVKDTVIRSESWADPQTRQVLKGQIIYKGRTHNSPGQKILFSQKSKDASSEGLIFPENSARNPKPGCITPVWVDAVGAALHKFTGWTSQQKGEEMLPLLSTRWERTALGVSSAGEKLWQLLAGMEASWRSGRIARLTHSLHSPLGSEWGTHLLTGPKCRNCLWVEWFRGETGAGHRWKQLCLHNGQDYKVPSNVWAQILALRNLGQWN